MKLLTYNFLTSTAIKGVQVGYPLILHVSLFLPYIPSAFIHMCNFKTFEQLMNSSYV